MKNFAMPNFNTLNWIRFDYIIASIALLFGTITLIFPLVYWVVWFGGFMFAGGLWVLIARIMIQFHHREWR